MEVVSTADADADKVKTMQMLAGISKTDERATSYNKKRDQETAWLKMAAYAAKIELKPESEVALKCRFVYHRRHPTDGVRAGTMCGNGIMVSSWKMAKYQRAEELGITEDKWDPSWKPSFRCPDCKASLLDRRQKTEDKKRLRKRSRSNE